MKFQAKAGRGFVAVKFIKGSLNRFDGKTLSLGFGDSKPLTRRKFVIFMRKVVMLAKQNKLALIAVDFKDLKSLAPKGFKEFEVAQVAATAFDMANYEHNTYKTRAKDEFAGVETIALPNLTEEG